MKVILKENVENLGRKGDLVDVADGYGRNYLVPRKLAIVVTSSNMKMIEMEQKALKKKFEKEAASYQGVIQMINETALTFERKAGEKDVIFGSVSSADIKEALDELGIEVDKKKILLDEPIKRLGNYAVPLKVFHDDRVELKVEVVKEGEIEARKEKAKEAAKKGEEEQKKGEMEAKEDVEEEKPSGEEKIEEVELKGEKEKEEEEAEAELKEPEEETEEKTKEKKKNKDSDQPSK
jgi:large subunit ribosomal protein L9